jgi:transcription initiation factor TFIIF subunit beta
MDEVQLTSRLFQCFNDKPYWGIPALKALLLQPDAWLREVLKKVADQIKEGPYANMWKLKETWRLEKMDGEDAAGDKDEEDDQDQDQKPDLGWDDDDDEDDFEEVM